MSQLKY